MNPVVLQAGPPHQWRLLDVLASHDRQRRLRLLQWLIACLVYSGAATLLVAGVGAGWMSADALWPWIAYVGLVLALGYAALRSGWSERFRDPSLTVWQLAAGVIAVSWGYLISGPMRTSALFPLMLIFAFAVLALRRRQIVLLTMLAVVGLVGVVAVRTLYPDRVPVGGGAEPFRVDVNNVVMMLVVLPAFAVIAARLSGLRRKLRDQRAALEMALAKVEYLTISDELTQLPNRRCMRMLLERSIALSDRRLTSFSVAILDIDHFKSINDRFGHAAGDDVLRAIGRLARARLRATDELGRWGGEEFLLVMPGVGDGVAIALSRIRAAVREGLHPDRAITLSAGVATHIPGETVDVLLARAERAMRVAKAGGRDQVQHDPG